jgi:hypothetical protein
MGIVFGVDMWSIVVFFMGIIWVMINLLKYFWRMQLSFIHSMNCLISIFLLYELFDG